MAHWKGREVELGFLAAMATGFGKNELVLGRGGEKGRQGGDGMFLDQAKLGAPMVGAVGLGGGLFIGHQWRFIGGRYFHRRLDSFFRLHVFKSYGGHNCNTPGVCH